MKAVSVKPYIFPRELLFQPSAGHTRVDNLSDTKTIKFAVEKGGLVLCELPPGQAGMFRSLILENVIAFVDEGEATIQFTAFDPLTVHGGQWQKTI